MIKYQRNNFDVFIALLTMYLNNLPERDKSETDIHILDCAYRIPEPLLQTFRDKQNVCATNWVEEWVGSFRGKYQVSNLPDWIFQAKKHIGLNVP